MLAEDGLEWRVWKGDEGEERPAGRGGLQELVGGLDCRQRRRCLLSTKAATEASEKTIVIQFRLLQQRRKYQAAKIIRTKHIEGLNERETQKTEWPERMI